MCGGVVCAWGVRCGVGHTPPTTPHPTHPRTHRHHHRATTPTAHPATHTITPRRLGSGSPRTGPFSGGPPVLALASSSHSSPSHPHQCTSRHHDTHARGGMCVPAEGISGSDHDCLAPALCFGRPHNARPSCGMCGPHGALSGWVQAHTQPRRRRGRDRVSPLSLSLFSSLLRHITEGSQIRDRRGSIDWISPHPHPDKTRPLMRWLVGAAFLLRVRCVTGGFPPGAHRRTHPHSLCC